MHNNFHWVNIYTVMLTQTLKSYPCWSSCKFKAAGRWRESSRKTFTQCTAYPSTSSSVSSWCCTVMAEAESDSDEYEVMSPPELMLRTQSNSIAEQLPEQPQPLLQQLTGTQQPSPIHQQPSPQQEQMVHKKAKKEKVSTLCVSANRDPLQQLLANVYRWS